jgi:carboxyl-terminal processing protease
MGSIGVVLGRHKSTGALHVRETPAGLTGALAGLKDGDQIKMIDGFLVDRLTPERIRELLRGPVGSKVILTVLRDDAVLHVEVTRAPLGRAPAASPASSPIE